jgi:anti-anti-sigma factor
MRAEKVIAMVGGVGNGSLRIFFTRPSAGVRCEGDIDATTRPVLIRALAVISEQTSGDLHADLGDVSFIDVGGLRVLVEATSKLAGERRFIVNALKPHTRRIIDMCGWTDLLLAGVSSASPGGRAVSHSSDVP